MPTRLLGGALRLLPGDGAASATDLLLPVLGLLDTLAVLGAREVLRLLPQSQALEAEADDGVCLGLELVSQLLGEVCLGHASSTGVNDLDDHLAALEQRVPNELASAEGHGHRGRQLLNF